MPIYFLTTKLPDPTSQRVSGGIISNLRLIEKVSDSNKVIFAPMLFADVPATLEENKSVTLEMPEKIGQGRVRYIMERYGRYRRRVNNAIKRHGGGILVSTRATIPVAHHIASSTGMPLVIITRAFEDLEQAGLYPPSDKITLFRRAEGLLNKTKIIQAYRQADLIITNSEYMGREIRRLFETQSSIYVSPPPMDLPKVEPTINEIGAIGFVNKGARKGRELILALAKKMPEKTFLIFGMPLELRNKNVCNVENLGYFNDRVAMFNCADLFLVPSVWDEPYGRVAAEAIWRGKPVIVSKRGGLPEAAPNELFWEESDDPDLWVKKINSLENSEHHSDIKTAIASAQNIIASNSSDDNLAEEIDSMI